MAMPLVSILIPAFNAEEWIADTVRSALAQTWQSKEVIVVDDGSTDGTLAVLQRFELDGVHVVTQQNQGAAAARNNAFSLSRGEYIQWLDADDLMSPDKIACQMEAVEQGASQRKLLSAQWGTFMYRSSSARFTPSALWENLSPVEWLLRKMGQNLFMANSSWLVSRELTNDAGPWDTRLIVDDDGEYFCRVLLASDGVRFVPDARVYYRDIGSNSVSHIGSNEKKIEAQWLSMQLHIQYLRSLEESERVRIACRKFLQNWYEVFYPGRPDLVAELKTLAGQLQGQLEEPRLRSKYAWMKPLLGRGVAKQAQNALPQIKANFLRHYDKAMYRLEGRTAGTNRTAKEAERMHS